MERLRDYGPGHSKGATPDGSDSQNAAIIDLEVVTVVSVRAPSIENDTEQFKPIARDTAWRRRFGIPDDAMLVLSVGRSR